MKKERSVVISGIGGTLMLLAFFMSFLRDSFVVLSSEYVGAFSLVIAVIGTLLLIYGLNQLGGSH